VIGESIIARSRSSSRRGRWCATTTSAGTAPAIRRLAGEEIPAFARVFALADALDALTSDRPYGAAVGIAQARDVIESSDGQFDPAVLEAFASISDERIEEIAASSIRRRRAPPIRCAGHANARPLRRMRCACWPRRPTTRRRWLTAQQPSRLTIPRGRADEYLSATAGARVGSSMPGRRGGSLMRDTRYWHRSRNGSVRDAEFVIERGEDVWSGRPGTQVPRRDASLWYANVGTVVRRSPPRSPAALAHRAYPTSATSPPRRRRARRGAGGPRTDAGSCFSPPARDSIDVAAKLARRTGTSSASRADGLVSRAQATTDPRYGTAIGGFRPTHRLRPQVESEQVAHDSVEALEQAIARVGAERIARSSSSRDRRRWPVPTGPPLHRGVAAICARNECCSSPTR